MLCFHWWYFNVYNFNFLCDVLIWFVIDVAHFLTKLIVYSIENEYSNHNWHIIFFFTVSSPSSATFSISLSFPFFLIYFYFLFSQMQSFWNKKVSSNTYGNYKSIYLFIYWGECSSLVFLIFWTISQAVLLKGLFHTALCQWPFVLTPTAEKISAVSHIFHPVSQSNLPVVPELALLGGLRPIVVAETSFLICEFLFFCYASQRA